jgi:CBS-domain-containing membrane protein
VILLYAVVLLVAVVVVARRDRAGGRGWSWFGAWCAAGGLFTFSLLAGFSIGLFVLPLAAAVLLFVASRSPHFLESLGFIAGGGAVALVVELAAGFALIAIGVAGYALAARRSPPAARSTRSI